MYICKPSMRIVNLLYAGAFKMACKRSVMRMTVQAHYWPTAMGQHMHKRESTCWHQHFCQNDTNFHLFYKYSNLQGRVGQDMVGVPTSRPQQLGMIPIFRFRLHALERPKLAISCRAWSVSLGYWTDTQVAFKKTVNMCICITYNIYYYMSMLVLTILIV